MGNYSALYSFMLMFLITLTWPTFAMAGVEEQLDQLKRNYDILASKLIRMEAQVARTGALELQVQQQQQLLNSLQLNERSESAATSTLRQGTATQIIPKSCGDLRSMGHTFSGMYLIMGTKSVETVFCDFCKPQNDSSSQKWIGYVDVKSKPVYFYVQKTVVVDKTGAPIPFEIAQVNIGGAMNLGSGIFTAPRAGTYYFSFSAVARFPAKTSYVGLGVLLLLNGRSDYSNWKALTTVSDINTDVELQWTPITLQATLDLQAGDRVWLELWNASPGCVLYNFDSRPYTHFTGWLLEEDISRSL